MMVTPGERIGNEALTPMLKQYLKIKCDFEDTILFYRMGDFYEMFFEDAIIASKIFNIPVTSRNQKDPFHGIPMCGIPIHAVNTYSAKLSKLGAMVAICEQVEDGVSGFSRREVIRVVTPTVTKDQNDAATKSEN